MFDTNLLTVVTNVLIVYFYYPSFLTIIGLFLKKCPFSIFKNKLLCIINISQIWIFNIIKQIRFSDHHIDIIVIMDSENMGLSQKLAHRTSIFQNKTPIELSYSIQIKAKVKDQQKIILHPQIGCIPPQSFTAILGPSGSGKTTFMNFLAGRLMSNNLTLSGEYKINGTNIKSIQPYSNQIGYVMQEDSLLAILTPRQCFQFAADLRLKLSPFQKNERVQQLIEQLGLVKCADVKIGNNFIKGVSGGQRKRTSIGIQLITNPSMIFLDEPTTGLDSTTALQVIQMLSELAKKGKTIISTIHQPSSQLFCQFDRLMILVEGRCIYSGSAEKSYDYFGNLGYKCPQMMNASQFYLEMISFHADEEQQQKYQQRKTQHDQKILALQSSYKASPINKINQDTSLEPFEPIKIKDISLIYELYLLCYRSIICNLRNPMDFALKSIQSIFTALIVIIVFGQIDNDSYQNLRGVAFFLVSSNAFGGIQGTIATFSIERPVFIRQRYSKSYSTFAYFFARTLCNFPFQLVYPTVGATIVYWITQMGHQTFQQYLRVLCSVNCVYFLSASYGLIYGTIIPKLETAMALVPVLIIPFMLLGGFFINLDQVDDIRVIFYPIMYLSPFKYGFQSMMLGIQETFGQKFTPNTFEPNIWIMFGLGVILRIFALIGLQIVSSPKRPKLHSSI